MTSAEPTRRRFLSYLGALGGLGILGGVAWAARDASGESAAAEVSTTAGADTTTLPTVAPTSTTMPPPTTTAPPTTTSITTPVGPAPQTIDVICPEAWGAFPVAGDFTPHTIERLTVHHTAVVLNDNEDAPGRARQHQQFHQERGWADLAYHFLIDGNGNVYVGRPVDAVGDTGTEYDPTGHFLVCCEGDFNQQEITDRQFAALVGMLAWAAEEFGVSPDTISGHRDWAQTSCPGDDLYGRLESGQIERATAELIDDGGARLNTICGDEGMARVADIEAGAV